MLSTPDFVFVHMPKTGGTFVTEMLRKVYGDALVEFGRKHGTCEEIPEIEHGKPVLSVIRSPFDRYVSQYHYGWWKTHGDEYCDRRAVLAEYPHYPEVSFSEFVLIANSHFVNSHRGRPTGYVNGLLPEAMRPGWHTEQYVRFFCRQPRTAFADLSERHIRSGALEEYEYPVHFLRTETLNRDLVEYLRRFQVPETVLRKILEHAPVQPDEAFEARAKASARDYFDDETTEFVMRREAFLFNRFPQYSREVA